MIMQTLDHAVRLPDLIASVSNENTQRRYSKGNKHATGLPSQRNAGLSDNSSFDGIENKRPSQMSAYSS